MESPPKPQRHIMAIPVPPITVNVHQFNQRETNAVTVNVLQSKMEHLSNIEDQMVDKAVADLPSVFSEVFMMQRGQSNEIQKQQTFLETLKEKVEQGEERKCELEQEIAYIMNKIVVMEEHIRDGSKRIKLIDADLKRLLTDIFDKTVRIQHLEDATAAEIRQLQIKKKEINVFSENVFKHEKSNSGVFNILKYVKKDVECLQEQEAALEKDREEMGRVLSGTMEKVLQSEIDMLKLKLLDTGNELKLLSAKISEEKQKQNHISETIQILHKRNKAQLTRLERQVNEFQLRNKQKQMQVSQLQNCITQAHKQINL